MIISIFIPSISSFLLFIFLLIISFLQLLYNSSILGIFINLFSSIILFSLLSFKDNNNF